MFIRSFASGAVPVLRALSCSARRSLQPNGETYFGRHITSAATNSRCFLNTKMKTASSLVLSSPLNENFHLNRASLRRYSISRFANPQSDHAFKKLFADPVSQEKLIHFLNSVLELADENQIQSIEIRDGQQTPKIEDDKLTILDVYAKDKKGYQYVIEMQIVNQTFFAKRAMFYATKIYSQQLATGERYENLKGVYFIGVLNFKLLDRPNDKPYFSHYKMTDLKSQLTLKEGVEIIFLELPKFQQSELQAKSPAIDKWASILKSASKWEDIPSAISDDPILVKALECLEMHRWTKDEIMAYEKAEMDRMTHQDMISTAKNEGKELGLAEGKELGLAEGKELGEELGLAKGKELGEELGLAKGKELGEELGLAKGKELAKRQLCINLFKNGITVAQVAKLTELSIDETQKIYQTFQKEES